MSNDEGNRRILPRRRFGPRFYLAWLFYNLLLHAAFFLLWVPALAWREFRGRFIKRLGFGLPRPRRRTLWLHAPSVGEALAIRAFVRELRAAFPHYEIVVTTFTAGGRSVAKQVQADYHLALPYDLVGSVYLTLLALRPAAFFFVEGDFWPNLAFVVQKTGVPTFVVNGRVSAKAVKRYKRFRWLFEPIFSNLTLVCAAAQDYVPLYKNLGVRDANVLVTGNLKYDNYAGPPATELVGLILAALGKPKREDVIIAASTHDGEEELIAETFGNLFKSRTSLRVIVAPRYPERAAIVIAALERVGFEVARRTSLPVKKPVTAVVLDTLGELPGLYPAAAVAVIGGTFVPRGGQNMVEAAYHGCVPVWGPHVWNFPMEVNMLAGKGGFGVSTPSDLEDILNKLLEDTDTLLKSGERAAAVVREMTGASARTVAAVSAALGEVR